jgi:Domain of unknown function (DUF397)
VNDIPRRAWRKSSYSGNSGNCVEVRGPEETADVRDSKNPDGPQLSFGPGAWSAFIEAVKLGKFDV